MREPFWLRLWRLRERLWARPLVYVLAAVAAVLLAQMADGLGPVRNLPEISDETIDKLLTVMASSMLAVATFAVGSMVQAFANASKSATPRAFPLVVASNSSQTALSVFLGAFIFSIVGLVALRVGLYESLGRLTLFALTLAVFAWVVGTFVRWVDDIARLGLMSNTIDRVEAAARRCLEERRDEPHLGGLPQQNAAELDGEEIEPERHGHVQLIDMERLQAAAERLQARVAVRALPGAFVGPGSPVLSVAAAEPVSDEDREELLKSVVIGDNRTFESDPRFGLITLSEIAARALSPAVNDPGTAIVILGRLVRLFAIYGAGPEHRGPVRFDRVSAPALSVADLFDDAFTAIARDGAGTVEVALRLQKAFATIAGIVAPGFADEASRHSGEALARARAAMRLEQDIARVEAAAL